MTITKNNDATAVAAQRGLDKPLLAFFALAYLISWGLIPLLAFIARQSGLDDWTTLSQMAESLNYGDTVLAAPGWLIYAVTRVQDFSFSIAGVVVVAVVYGRDGLRTLFGRLLRWRVGWRWWLVALLPFALYGLATAVAGVGSSFTMNGRVLQTILVSAEAGLLVTLFLRGPMGEELGLRGFALTRLQTRMSPFRASGIIGIAWALWHLPVLLNRDLFSIIVFLLLAFVLSFLFTWLFNGSGGSLIPVLIFHAAQNTEEIWETMFPALVGSDWELISSIGLLLMGIVVAVHLWRTRQQPVPQV